MSVNQKRQTLLRSRRWSRFLVVTGSGILLAGLMPLSSSSAATVPRISDVAGPYVRTGASEVLIPLSRWYSGAMGASLINEVRSVHLLAGVVRTSSSSAATTRSKQGPKKRGGKGTVGTSTITTAHPTTTTLAPVLAGASSTTSTTTTVPATTTIVEATNTVLGGVVPASGDGGVWSTIFDSEFTGTTLDTSQWNTGWFGTGITQPVNSLEQDCYDPGQVNVSNGSLNLSVVAKSETCGNKTEPYASGLVDTVGKFSFTYGYMEAKIWLPGTGLIADWPAFWADGVDWPIDGELDVMEGLGGTAQAHFHYQSSTGTALADSGLGGNGNYTGGWHTFGADWEPGKVTYYYDKVDIGSYSTGISAAPMYLILNLAVSSAITPVTTAPATMKVAYVRVWQH